MVFRGVSIRCRRVGIVFRLMSMTCSREGITYPCASMACPRASMPCPRVSTLCPYEDMACSREDIKFRRTGMLRARAGAGSGWVKFTVARGVGGGYDAGEPHLSFLFLTKG